MKSSIPRNRPKRTIANIGGICLSVDSNGNEERVRKQSTAQSSSWSVNTFKAQKPKKRLNYIPVTYSRDIGCIPDIIEDSDRDGTLMATLEFTGFYFTDNFVKSARDYGENTCVYYVSINYGVKKAFLILATLENVLELEVVPKKKGIDVLWSYKVDIPQLMKTHNPSSMGVSKRNNVVAITWRKE